MRIRRLRGAGCANADPRRSGSWHCESRGPNGRRTNEEAFGSALSLACRRWWIAPTLVAVDDGGSCLLVDQRGQSALIGASSSTDNCLNAPSVGSMRAALALAEQALGDGLDALSVRRRAEIELYPPRARLPTASLSKAHGHAVHEPIPDPRCA